MIVVTRGKEYRVSNVVAYQDPFQAAIMFELDEAEARQAKEKGKTVIVSRKHFIPVKKIVIERADHAE